MSTTQTAAPAAPKTIHYVTNAQGNQVQAIDQERVMQIINKRVTVKPTDVGSSIILQIQGDPTFIAKGHKYSVAGEERENAFDRHVYNVRASSALAMTSPEGKKLFKEAMMAEAAGDIQLAHDKFNAYLNFIQLSFAVIANPGARVFQRGDDVKARVIEAVSKTGNKSLQLEDVSYQAPKVLAKTTFAIADLMEA